MKGRIRIAGATLMAAAGLLGAVAAPASAERPLFLFSMACHNENGLYGALRIAPAGEAQRLVTEAINEANCFPGTVTLTSVERFP